MVQLLWKQLHSFKKKISIYLTYGPTSPFLVIYPKEIKAYVQIHKDLDTNVHNTFICNGQNLKQLKCSPTGKWINKMWNSHVMEYYSAIKKNKC